MYNWTIPEAHCQHDLHLDSHHVRHPACEAVQQLRLQMCRIHPTDHQWIRVCQESEVATTIAAGQEGFTCQGIATEPARFYN